LPAAYCGIVGYKATLTGIDRGNVRQLRPTLDTIGLFARSIPDIASLHAVLCGSAGPLPQTSIRQLRIGICRTNSWQQAQPETVEALESATIALAAAGASTGEAVLPPEFDGVEESFGVISTVEASRALAIEARDHMPKLNSWIRGSLAAAASHDQSRYDNAQHHAIECQSALAGMFQRFDVLLTPSTAGEAPADLVSISSSVFNRIWTLMHVPCLTIPAYRGPNGMPVGIQVVGPIGADVRTMSAAKAIFDALK
jgi:Asp-tRNA(Asn)/Glu-tRNA(Gln) amidotransferase A subunit family amidase